MGPKAIVCFDIVALFPHFFVQCMSIHSVTLGRFFETPDSESHVWIHCDEYSYHVSYSPQNQSKSCTLRDCLVILTSLPCADAHPTCPHCALHPHPGPPLPGGHPADLPGTPAALLAPLPPAPLPLSRPAKVRPRKGREPVTRKGPTPPLRWRGGGISPPWATARTHPKSESPR